MFNESSSRGEASDSTQSRRTFLKGAAATGTALAGVGAAAMPTSAQWLGGGGGGVEEFDLSGGSAPESFPNNDASELLVWLHGLGGGATVGFQASRFQDTLESAGYEGTVIAGSYNSAGVSGGLATGGSDSADRLADLIENYYDTTGGSLRIVGHSMGGFLTYQTINALGDSYTLDTAASVGTGTPANLACTNGVYGDAIANNTGQVRVYISDNDNILSSFGGDQTECGGLLGDGSKPENLTHVDVTDDVANHIDYWGSSAVAEDLVGSFDQSTDGGDGSSGDGSSGDGSSGDGSADDGSEDDDSSFGWWS